VLDEWQLRGTPEEWPAQLEELYVRQPVFAVVGGLGDGDWTPIAAYCERRRLPVVLPQVPAPPAASPDDGFYSLYFSRGVVAEARAIARHLAAVAPSGVLQLARCGGAGEAAAKELARALPGVDGQCVAEAAAPGAWTRQVGGAQRLVLWLDARDRDGLEALAGSPALSGVTEVYLSSTLLGDEAVGLPAPLAERAVLASPFVPPDAFAKHAARSLVWMKASGIQATNRRVAVNALFAAVLASDALAMPKTLGSREYFVETIEHMAGRSLNPTAYPSVSFAPGRRFASEGAALLRVPLSPDQPFGKVEEWSAPSS
jgi:hypothetical protein